ncbi:sigma-70 family RNA polymerase sigma factor [Caenimonas aquaedulcis]|uniref:Sigma-70 family RNA polymerase sigma factor n=1 Tax=Caenimonas aquaedulcis TaxID=2793270 RepID=A0A931H5I9_9BURK|nr:sigma-70 family RNA polymerase sigma factor [Caenimonas aquaedulcis]MBG9389009.1 sigma-70 family RNA polymerase sigma factor [Caenimonas aquaedulcis]
MKTPDPTLPDPDFPQLMAQLRARLHRYCARMTGSTLDGEDVVQDTLIKANERYDAAAVQNVEGWLFRIAHNASMDFLRQRTRDQAVLAWGKDVEGLPGAGEEADRRHVATAALRTFMRLPPAQRSAVILADVLGYALEETADVMATTVPAVKAALHRGRTRLKELSQQPEDAAAPPPLTAQDQALLAAYAERFNARDFDGLREMLAEEVRLDLVARRKPMQMRDGEYFSRYAMTQGLRVTPMNVEGRPGLWVDTQAEEGAGAPGYAVVLAWQGGKVTGIRDFRYARYAGEGLA